MRSLLLSLAMTILLGLPCESLSVAEVWASLSKADLDYRAALSFEGNKLLVGLEAKPASDWKLAANLDLRLTPWKASGLSLGKGRDSGPLLYMEEPCALGTRLGSEIMGSPIALDPSLKSLTSVADLQLGAFNLFALYNDKKEACGGIAFTLEDFFLKTRLLSLFSFPLGSEARTNAGFSHSRTSFHHAENQPLSLAAIFLESSGQDFRDSAALAFSTGSLMKQSFSIRLESALRMGFSALSLACAAASPDYQAKDGQSPNTLFSAGSALSLVADDAVFKLSSSLEAVAGSWLSVPNWQHSERLSADILLGEVQGPTLDMVIWAKTIPPLVPRPSPFAGFSLALRFLHTADLVKESSSFSASLRWGPAFWEARLGFSSESLYSSVILGSELSLGFPLLDFQAFKCIAQGKLRLGLPIEGGGSISLELALGESSLLVQSPSGIGANPENGISDPEIGKGKAPSLTLTVKCMKKIPVSGKSSR